MPSATRARRSFPATRARSSSQATTGRFGRAATPRRHAVAGEWLQRRRPQKQSAFRRALGGLGRAKPRVARQRPQTKGRRRGGVMGGLAVLAGAAGLAFKNRDKVASMTRRGGDAPPPH
jgi:hypothetical protein